MAKRTKSKKKVTKEKEPDLSKPLKEAIIQFIQLYPAKSFSRNLRRMLLEHLMYDGATESIYLYETLRDLDGLFDLLDVIETEWPVSEVWKDKHNNKMSNQTVSDIFR